MNDDCFLCWKLKVNFLEINLSVNKTDGYINKLWVFRNAFIFHSLIAPILHIYICASPNEPDTPQIIFTNPQGRTRNAPTRTIKACTQGPPINWPHIKIHDAMFHKVRCSESNRKNVWESYTGKPHPHIS